jgi:predicted O-methyltransferase YrrM
MVQRQVECEVLSKNENSYQMTTPRVLTFEARAGEQLIGLLYLCRFLKAIIYPPKCIVEIGSYCGASGSAIAKQYPDSTVHCVDPWTAYTEDCTSYDLERQAKELIEAEAIFDEVAKNHPNMVKVKMSGCDYAKTIPEASVDLVYIDGNHQRSSVLEDVVTWYPKVKRGGAISGHDYPWPSVQSALQAFFKKTPDAVFCDGSWVYFLT